jgi:hypothetical protein
MNKRCSGRRPRRPRGKLSIQSHIQLRLCGRFFEFATSPAIPVKPRNSPTTGRSAFLVDRRFLLLRKLCSANKAVDFHGQTHTLTAEHLFHMIDSGAIRHDASSIFRLLSNDPRLVRPALRRTSTAGSLFFAYGFSPGSTPPAERSERSEHRQRSAANGQPESIRPAFELFSFSRRLHHVRPPFLVLHSPSS